MGQLTFQLLGVIEGRRGGAVLDLGPPKQRAFLALLLLNANHAVSRERLVDELWPGEPPPTAVKALQVFASRLRKALGEDSSLLVTRGQGYSFEIDPELVDAARFERLLAEGQASLAAGRHHQAQESLREALALWRGEALADADDEGFAARESARLGELRLQALELRIEADLALGAHAAAVAELESLVAAEPLRERLHGLLMLALYRSSRQADALAAYQSARKLLVDELGIDPGTGLQELHRAILAQDAGLDPPAARPHELEEAVRRERPPPARLPEPLTPLVGRTHELAHLNGFVEDGVRLITLTGPGGTGKTRLGLALAAQLAPRFDDVWFVGLAAVTEPDLVRSEIERVVAAEEPLETFLARRSVLLVLDNFEQVIAAAGEVAALLGEAPDLTVVATSRERLRLRGEREYPLDPLPEQDAVELFLDRARAVDPDFIPNGHVTAICRRLDGLPLAVELAAARVKVLSPEALLARLDRRLASLGTGARDLPERQQTLHALIEWSYDLLSAEEQHLFRRLGVFAGGFGLEAAEQVCEASLDTLASLIDKSLVRMTRGRFELLQTIREYAVERLEAAGEADTFHERHARWLRSFVADLDERLWGSNQLAAFEAGAQEDPNVRAAIEWALQHDAELALELATDMGWYWFMRGHYSDARRLLEAALANPSGSDELRAKALLRLATALDDLGETEAALDALEHCIELRRSIGDLSGVAAALANLGGILTQGDRESIERARPVIEESAGIARELGDEVGVAVAICNLGVVELNLGLPDRARPLFEEALVAAKTHGHDWGIAVCHGNLGAALIDLDEPIEGNAHFLASLKGYHDLGHVLGVLGAVEGIACIAALTGEAASTARYFGATDAARASMAAARLAGDVPRVERARALALDQIGAVEYERHAHEGASLLLDDVVSELLGSPDLSSLSSG